MKQILRNNSLIAILVVFAGIFASEKTVAQVYSTRTAGNWNDVATWANGLIPPAAILPTMTVNINHNVTYNGILDISNLGTIRLQNSTGTTPVLKVPTGIKVENGLTGKFYIKNAEYRQYRFVNGGNTGTAQTGSFTNNGGYLEVYNSIVEVAEDWMNKSGGKRIFRKGILLTGADYESKDNGSVDTLDRVSVSMGWQNKGDFKITSGSVYFNQAKIQMAGLSSKFKFNGGIGSGDIDYITFKNQVTGVTGTGDLTVGGGVTTSSLNLDAYCASSTSKYQSNSKFVGSQTMDCSMNYFPSGFLIQQTANLSSGLSFSNAKPEPVGATASLLVGAKYRFPSVNDSADAIVSIDSLIGNAKVESIDDNTAGTGYSFAFQPRVTSGNLVGRSYAVFTIQFVKAGTSTPISVQYINATPLDIDGGSTLKEFAEINMGEGATMNYMSTATDITVLTNLAPQWFGAQNSLGIERDNIDTLSYNNMFTVANTEVSSFRIKYGTYTSSPSTTTRQFSLYMKGFSYPIMAMLPVKLSSFTAVLNNGKANLKWNTDSEENLSHFIVERSTDGTNFSEIGMVFAYGNSSTVKDYVFSDNLSSLPAGMIYYRLRSVNVNAKFEYSTIRVVRKGQQEITAAILTYPNPATTDIRVTIPASWQNKKVVYEIFSVNGSTARRIESASSNQTESVNINSLQNGIYIMKVTCEGQTAQQKFVKQ